MTDIADNDIEIIKAIFNKYNISPNNESLMNVHNVFKSILCILLIIINFLF